MCIRDSFLGCWLTEPSNLSVFDGPEGLDVDLEEDWPAHGRLVLDRRSRMLYRGKQLFINGETAMTPASPAPVSYTHLDVYKRQGRTCSG